MWRRHSWNRSPRSLRKKTPNPPIHILYSGTIAAGASMAVPATAQEFLDLVRKNGAPDENPLHAYLAKLRAHMPADAPKAAGHLAHSGILPNFQPENILAGKWRR